MPEGDTKVINPVPAGQTSVNPANNSINTPTNTSTTNNNMNMNKNMNSNPLNANKQEPKTPGNPNVNNNNNQQKTPNGPNNAQQKPNQQQQQQNKPPQQQQQQQQNQQNKNNQQNQNKQNGQANNNNNNNNKQNNNNQNNQNGGQKNNNNQNKQQNQNQKQNQNRPQQNKAQNGNFNPNQYAQMSQQQQGEKKFTGRCRLFVGNLPSDITEQEFKDLFTKFGETGECFLNTQRSFGFIKLDTRINAEHAKQELDGFTLKGRCIRVRFASHGAAVRVKNLSPYVSNEYLEQSFSMFGPVERAVVIVDDKGRPTGEGIVEFERKPAASQCINRCTENCFILTSYPKPVIVEPLDQKDDEDGLPEKSIIKNQQFHSEREIAPHFAPNNSFEHELALKWRDLYELEKQIKEEGLKKIQEAREQLEYEIEVRLIDYKEQKLKEDLRAKQEELQRIEDMRKNEFQRRKDMENRRQEEDRRRQEEMMLFRKQQENIMMQQQSNQRPGPMPNGGGPGMGPNNFDQPMVNNQPPVGGGNRRFDQNQPINQLPQQQQAMLAAQLSAFAMAAAGNLNLPLFDQQGGPNMPNNGNNNNRQGGDNRRNFNRRNGGQGRGPNNNREDQSPFPGYDNKRARY